MKKSFTPNVTKKKLEFIEEQIAQFDDYLSDMDAHDKEREKPRIDILKEKIPRSFGN